MAGLEIRQKVKMGKYELRRSATADRVAIFIPGFGDSGNPAYWKDVPDLLAYEHYLMDMDLCFWRYAGSKSPFANMFSLIGRSRKAATIDETARVLSQTIEELCAAREYKSVALVGHSLGGIVGTLCASYELEALGKKRIKRILLLGTPQQAPWVARAASGFSWWNPHLQYLANPEVLFSLFNVKLQNLRKGGLWSTYVHYSLDELLSLYEEIDFDERLSIEASHAWMAGDVMGNSGPYGQVVTWLKQFAST